MLGPPALLWLALPPLLLAGCAKHDPGAENAAANGAAISGAAAANMSAPIVDKDIARAKTAVPMIAPIASPAPPAQNLPRRDVGYRALGTEPFWAVTLRGDRATLERPDHSPRSFTGATTDDDGRTRRYIADGLTLTITPGPCSDGMSDSIWSDSVQVAFGEGTLKGCGGDKEMPEDN
ncbi:membrane-like protein [Sphingobium sp. AN641]|uniref:COG3650 family protein n=1 Tax=Sphingobium sp. AN641 TaxID=3133443 RepID=UPI0030BEFEDD